MRALDKTIQNICIGNVMRFTSAPVIASVISNFPSFNVAKVGRTALQAASAWSAVYVDDLDTLNISGGITAE